MADSNTDEVFDDLDAFFSAAAKADQGAMRQAAQNVAGSGPRRPTKAITRPTPPPRQPVGKHAKVSTQSLIEGSGPSGPTRVRPAPAEESYEDLDGKFIAIDPESLDARYHDAGDEPFVLIPAHIHSILPWWGWLTIALGIVVMVAGVLLMPVVSLERLTARLGDANQRNAEGAMRQLVLQGDERTVGKLYDMAASRSNVLATRLRAVDTLSLIQAPDADRALLRLELADGTDAQVREAAVAARRQREAAKTRTRGR